MYVRVHAADESDQVQFLLFLFFCFFLVQRGRL